MQLTNILAHFSLTTCIYRFLETNPVKLKAKNRTFLIDKQVFLKVQHRRHLAEGPAPCWTLSTHSQTEFEHYTIAWKLKHKVFGIKLIVETHCLQMFLFDEKHITY